VLDIAHYITQTDGGKGAFREVTELVLKAQGKWDLVLEAAEKGTIGTSPKRTPVLEDFKQWKI
jgi:hypothetical protein